MKEELPKGVALMRTSSAQASLAAHSTSLKWVYPSTPMHRAPNLSGLAPLGIVAGVTASGVLPCCPCCKIFNLLLPPLESRARQRSSTVLWLHTMGGSNKHCARLDNCKWFTKQAGTLYQTGLRGNKTVVQDQTARNEWMRTEQRRAKALRKADALVPDSTGGSRGERDSLQDLRLYSRTPGDPFVRAYMISKAEELKEQERDNLWTANLERIERIRARDRERFGDHSSDHAEPRAHFEVSDGRRNDTVWTRPGTVSTGPLAAGGGHHMLSRSSMRESMYMLPNPSVPLTDFGEYERITTSQDDKECGRKSAVGRDFLGCRRLIEPVPCRRCFTSRTDMDLC